MRIESQKSGCAQKTLNFLVIVFVIVIMLAGSALIVGALWAAWVGFKTLSKEVQVTVGAGVMAVVGSVASLIVTNQFNRRRDLEQELRKKKEPVYEELLEFCFRVGSDYAEATNKEEHKAFMNRFSQKLLLWGSDDVVKSYVDARKTIGVSLDNKEITLSFEKIFRAIRSDFGHKNTNLNQGDLLTFMMAPQDLSVEEDFQRDINVNRE